ncbi:MAG: ABC-F family ATP-binding cassette domain-containing protein [Chloroflexi bacterium]|nr:ABC-F family ATP-binding cassette domain-containing protein [Chloroflexota bacterium]
MIIYALDKVSKYWGASVVLDQVSWEIDEHARAGLVGPNGAGKSTAFKIIAGEYEPDGGFISRRRGLTIGYMEQEPQLDPGLTVVEAVRSGGGAELLQIEGEMRATEAQMAEPEVYQDEKKLARALEQHARLVEAFEQKGGLNFESRVISTLRGLGFAEADFDLSCAALSGGQKKLVGLARLLVTRPDLLLLDEPDNHLDLKGKLFLEQFIADYPGAVVIVSHDRYLLDVVAEEIVEIEDHHLRVWSNCNYSEYAYTKKMALLRQQQMYELQQKEIARLEMSVRRLMGWGAAQNEKFVRRAHSIEKRIEKIPRIDRPILERKTMGLEFNVNGRGSNKVLEVQNVSKRFDGAEVLRHVNLLVWQGERVGLIGPNGAGKSVLFRSILGQEQPSHGAIRLGPSNVVGYYAQEHETLDYNATLMEEVRRLRPMSEREAAGLMGRFLFGFDRAGQKVSSLSGGEKARLQMLKLMMGNYNFLLLDEPTNNLDIASAEVLEDALDEYRGTLLVISHDRYFLDRIVNRIVELEDGTLKEYLGNYTYYKEQKAKQAPDLDRGQAARAQAPARNGGRPQGRAPDKPEQTDRRKGAKGTPARAGRGSR